MRNSGLSRSRAAAGPRVRWLAMAATALVVVALGFTGYRLLSGPGSGDARAFPRSPAMEEQYGIRFSRVAVVGDGGLITLTYVVLDSEKATRFQSDLAHAPQLVSESRPLGTQRVSVMKQGHSLRVGQTYYLVYQNTRGALRPGELATIVEGDVRLEHVPVL
jgi:hypothetical protein